MSKVKIEGNASGTGTLTIAAPNTNTDRTLTLPDGAGEVVVTDGTTLVVDNANDKVGIGTSSPTTTLDVTTTIRSNANAGTNDATVGKYSFYNTNASASANPERAYIEAGRENSAWGAYLKFGTSTGTSAATERMRIDSSGNLLVGLTSTPVYGSTQGFSVGSNGRTQISCSGTGLTVGRKDTNGWAVTFMKDATQVGNISVTASSTAYNTSSDYRLKTDVQPMTGATERLKALKPVNFEWIISGERVDGFLAHEAQEVVPEAVVGTKDAVDADGNPDYQGIDQSKLVPLLTSALQEAISKIEDLETRLAAVEGAE